MKKLIGSSLAVSALLFSELALAGGNVGAGMNMLLSWVQIAAYVFSALIFMAGLLGGFKAITSFIAWGKDQQSGTTTQQGAAGGDKGKAAAIYVVAAIAGIFFGGLVFIFAQDMGIQNNNPVSGMQIDQ